MGETTWEEGARPEVSIEWREGSVSWGEKNTGEEEEGNFIQTEQATVPKKKKEKRSFPGHEDSDFSTFLDAFERAKKEAGAFFLRGGPGLVWRLSSSLTVRRSRNRRNVVR